MTRERISAMAILLLIVFVPGCCTGPQTSVTSEDYDTELTAWRAEGDTCTSAVRVAGTCGDDMLFTYDAGGGGATTRFFNADTGAYLGYEYSSSTLLPVYFCGGSVYWPEDFDCSDGEVTEVFCGEVEVGDAFEQ